MKYILFLRSMNICRLLGKHTFLLLTNKFTIKLYIKSTWTQDTKRMVQPTYFSSNVARLEGDQYKVLRTIKHSPWQATLERNVALQEDFENNMGVQNS